MSNVRASKFEIRKEEFDSKLASCKRLKNGLEEFLNKSFYFERMSQDVSLTRVIREDPKLALNIATGRKGASFRIVDGNLPILKEAYITLDIVRIIYDNKDAMIELAEELLGMIGRHDALSVYLVRFDAE